MPKFQFMIRNGGVMKCGGHCENVRLQLGDSSQTSVLAINMGGCNMVLGEKWIHTMDLVNMDFKKLCLIFTQHSHTDTLKGL